MHKSDVAGGCARPAPQARRETAGIAGLGGAAAARGGVAHRAHRTACAAASPDAAAARQSRPGTDRRESRRLLLRGGCGSRAPTGTHPLRGPWPAAQASPGWGSPCRFRFWRCRCAGTCMRPANWRWLRWRARRISRTCPATCRPASVASGHRRAGHQLRGQENRLLDIEGPVASSAKGVAGSVLHEPAVLTPHYFACFHAD